MEVLGWWVNSPMSSSVEQVPDIQQIPKANVNVKVRWYRRGTEFRCRKADGLQCVLIARYKMQILKIAMAFLQWFHVDAQFRSRHRVVERVWLARAGWLGLARSKQDSLSFREFQVSDADLPSRTGVYRTSALPSIGRFEFLVEATRVHETI